MTALSLELAGRACAEYFRMQAVGLEHVPAEGGALLVANHSGVLPFDTLLIMDALRRRHPAPRTVHNIADELLFSWPGVGAWARATGRFWPMDSAVAKHLLRSGELLLVYPEGIRGLGKLYADRYQVQDFGRGGFAAVAMAAEVPIVPISVVGAEDFYRMLADCPPLARLLRLPYFPVTPVFPWLGPAGLIPFPARVTIRFGAPIRVPAARNGTLESYRSGVETVAARTREAVQAGLDARDLSTAMSGN
ncbi:hypothetical protein GCM10009839_92010 [Catenulispora yoronensis]|uniref:Phospholipid/glycerol acyltransferase domain-containing protein n=1 Tax=Catenulispora yoronensis TaxID=450799 RepID=A0ABN2VM46_9ACTN